MEDPSAQAQLDVAEEKARLQAAFQRELQEHRDLLNAEFARRTEAMRAELIAGGGGPPPTLLLHLRHHQGRSTWS
jgi:hypothetical protein